MGWLALAKNRQCPALLKGRGHIDRALPEIAPQRSPGRALNVSPSPSQSVPMTLDHQLLQPHGQCRRPENSPSPSRPRKGGRSVTRRRSVITETLGVMGGAVVPLAQRERVPEGRVRENQATGFSSSRPPHPACSHLLPGGEKGRRPVRAKWRLMHGACRPGETP